jgi:hypothetical protein
MTLDLGASARGRVASAVLTTVMVAGLLAGCGGSNSSSQSTTSASTTPASTSASTTPATTSTPAATTSASTTTTAAPSGDSGSEAAPGATFKPGQSEVVRYQQLGNSGNYGPANKLKLTIETITAGSMSDFKDVSLSGVPKGSIPTYVKVSMTNLGPQTLKTSDTSPDFDVQGVTNGSQLDSSVSIGGFFAPCPDATAPNPFPVGKTFNTCLTFLVPGGVTKIAYNGADEYLNSPVFWSK